MEIINLINQYIAYIISLITLSLLFGLIVTEIRKLICLYKDKEKLKDYNESKNYNEFIKSFILLVMLGIMVL